MAEQTHFERSYRALLRMQSLMRVLVGMQLARIAQSMMGVVLVLFAFIHYDSPALAGSVLFASLAPGLLISPIAGAILDRHGRIRFVILDYVVAFATLVSIGVLSLEDSLPPWLLLVITAIGGLTQPLSNSGLRSLFPLIVPEPLWERVNALDSNGWVLATLVAAPLAGVATQIVGFEPTFFGMAAAYAAAAVLMIGAPDPRGAVASTGSLLVDAWQGVVYTWHNRTLRALAISLSILNVGLGMLEIFLPAVVIHRLGFDEDTAKVVVGYLFGLQGLAGVISAFIFGRVATLGRERVMIALPVVGIGASLALFVAPGGLLPLVIAMAIGGLLNGPLDISMFTLRQRRTDTAWMGRAVTVSMTLNFSGWPIGAAIAGFAVTASLDATVIAATVICIVAGLLAWRLIPRAATPAVRIEERPTEQPV